MNTYWAGPGDDLQAVIDAAPAGSKVYTTGHFQAPITLKSGVHLQGVSQGEYDARELRPLVRRSMNDCVIHLTEVVQDMANREAS